MNRRPENFTAQDGHQADHATVYERGDKVEGAGDLQSVGFSAAMVEVDQREHAVLE